MNFSTSELRLVDTYNDQWMDSQVHAAVKKEEILFETIKNHDVCYDQAFHGEV